MAKDSVITAIDLGTDKCVTLVSSVSHETGNLQVLGVSVVKSAGMKKSAIVDLEKVLATLTQSLDGAERMAGCQVNQAWLSIGGTHIKSQNSKGVVAVAHPNQEITSEDVERVIEAAQAVSLPNDRQIIHVIPKDFKVDSQAGIKDPVGMTGIRLESEAHIISGMSTALKNLKKSVVDLGVDEANFVFSGLAAAYSTATETEKELGVAIVDIGSGSTSICVFVEGSLEYSTSLPIGARHITQDIALGCRISLEVAEKIKNLLSQKDEDDLKPRAGESKEEFNRRKKKFDDIDLEKLNLQEEGCKNLSKKAITEGIMEPRMKEIFSLIGQELEKKNLFDLIPAGLIITGGGASTISMASAAKKTLQLPARVGRPNKLEGLTNDITGPAYATVIGLLEYAYAQKNFPIKKTSSFNWQAILPKFKFSLPIGRVAKLVRSLLP